MHAMILDAANKRLAPAELGAPAPADDQIVIEVAACAVCRTDLHVVDGELPHPKPSLVPGHEIIGRVAAKGARVDRFAIGDRVGLPWLGWTCGVCAYCRSGRENLCDRARFTGYQIDGGFAEFAAADHRFCFPIPASYSDEEASPLLCAGLIGYRALRMTGEARRVGFYGFGDSAHILIQICRWQGREVYAFTRGGDAQAQSFARELGAVWAGASDQPPPAQLEAAILFAPVGALVLAALRTIAKGGVVVSGGIYMSDIPSFAYRLFWEERMIRSVANLTRSDGREFMAIAEQVPIETSVEPFPLDDANQALESGFATVCDSL